MPEPGPSYRENRRKKGDSSQCCNSFRKCETQLQQTCKITVAIISYARPANDRTRVPPVPFLQGDFIMRHVLLGGAACIALVAPMPALAQSTGTIDFEGTIVVTGVATKDVGGVQAPKTSKAKAVLTQEMIARQAPGQSVDDVINMVPGVSFQNNDPFGSAGGTLTIRGFDDSRISQTFDGIPLNDSGNYALYSNQQIDPEIIDQVNVNLGSTDVDSPTASASGSTVNIRSITPSDDFGVKVAGSFGDFDFMRVFGMVQTGEFTPWGTKAWFSASTATNNNIYGVGKIEKQQYNAKIYQPLGDNGDFISLAGHYNANRNNFFGSVPLRLDASRVVGSSSSNRFPMTKDERFYAISGCSTATPVYEGVTVAQATASGYVDPDAPNSCGTPFDFRYNPSNTGNIRLASRFTLADGLVLTVEPNYQYTKANGGGTTTGYEYGYRGSNTGNVPAYGYIGGRPYFGVDLNGDGDMVDAVTVAAPSQTATNRIALIASLRWDFSDNQTVRLSYTYDRARHRQTGEVGYVLSNGFSEQYFPIDNPLTDINGTVLQKRDRLSWAILHQVSGEYSGRFMDDRLGLNIGLRAPFMRRNLNQYCYTTSASGNVNCSVTAVSGADYSSFVPTAYAAPQQRVLDYNKVLPNAGITFDLTPALGIFANYSKGMQVPGTDNLYQSFYFAADSDAANPRPETTDNFDIGLRYRSSTVQAQLSGWFTKYSNRLASSYDQETQVTIYRNLGTVHKYGIDGSIAYQPVKEALFYVWGSYMKSDIRSDVVVGSSCSANAASYCYVADGTAYYMTKGKRESGSPEYTLGARAQFSLGPVDIGGQVKRTGPRYINDVNTPLYSSGAVIYPSRAPAYTLVDLDARVKMGWAGLNDQTFVQLNMLNVFDELYVGGFDGVTDPTTVPFAQIGYPRTFMASLVVAF